MITINNTELDIKGYVDELKENVDHVYLLTNAIFVCSIVFHVLCLSVVMQCGFACLEAGSIRTKNVTNILMKNILDIFISCLAYWMVGYAVAYGRGNSFIGLTNWAGVGLSRNKYSHWFFQFIFAATAATIVSGAVAERCSFVAYLVYSAVISGFIYPTVSHWIWTEDGWLSNMGYSDFAGSGAVHLLGGTCSLVAAIMLGPRIGRFEGVEMPGHSIPLVGIGGFILITGFLAFNGGSLGTMTTPCAGTTISLVIINTVIGGTAGAGIVLLAGRVGLAGARSWNFCLTLNGALTGMVSVCAGVDLFRFWSSFLIGAIGGLVYLGFHHLIPLCKVDDPLDAVAVHLGGGLWGVLAAPIFRENGILSDPDSNNFLGLLYNSIGGLAIFCWSLITCFIMFGCLKWVNCLRVSREEELRGLDISKHKETAYPLAGWSNITNLFQSAHCKCNINMDEDARKTPRCQEYANHSYQDDKL